jgi:hypothetical protein
MASSSAVSSPFILRSPRFAFASRVILFEGRDPGDRAARVVWALHSDMPVAIVWAGNSEGGRFTPVTGETHAVLQTSAHIWRRQGPGAGRTLKAAPAEARGVARSTPLRRRATQRTARTSLKARD